MSYSELWQRAAELDEMGEPYVLVTLLSSKGSSPQEIGAKALVSSQGLEAGTVGGGKIEARCIARALELIKEATPVEPIIHTWNLQKDIGMSCGGEGSYLFELTLPSKWSVAIFGAGHVAQALARTLLPLSVRLTIVDERPEWIAKLPTHAKLKALTAEPQSVMPQFNEKTFFISVTKGHASDVPVLAEIMKAYPRAPFVGVIGSEIKGQKIRQELLERGLKPEVVEKLRCPVGLKIGNNDPAEIAISVAAELLQVRGEH